MSQVPHSGLPESASRLKVDEFKHRSRPSSSRDRIPHASLSAGGPLQKTKKASQAARLSSSPHSRVPSATGLITAMTSGVAHQIRSAQIVLDPAAVIKELLENALDAGATRIDIRVRGKAALESIAVSDNGKGISKEDYSSVCLSASTSKITDFADLDSVATFGFRGEALSAICAISKSVSVVTRTTVDSIATSLRYAPDGSLQSQSPVARPKGTTVLVEALFHKLPVRRKDALKNSSREIARCVSVVQALALISVGIRIELKISQDIKVLSQPSSSGAFLSSPLVSLERPLNLRGLRHAASCVLGNRTASALMELPLSQIAALSLPSTGRNCDKQSVTERHYCCSGLVSKASLDANGSGGRAKSSYQYIFANRRPVNFPRMTRAVNELYKRTTGLNGASPVLILNLDLPAGSHDANLSPDKRDLLVRDENELISGLLKYLETFWAPKKVAQIPLQTLDFDNVVNAPSKRADTAVTEDLFAVASLNTASGKGTSNERPAVNATTMVEDVTPRCSVPGEHRVRRTVLNDTEQSDTEPQKSKSSAERQRLLEILCPSKRNVAAFVARHADSVSVPSKRQKLKSGFSSSAELALENSATPFVHEVKDRSRNCTELDKPPKDVVVRVDRPSPHTERPNRAKPSVRRIDWNLVCRSQLPMGKKLLLKRSEGGGGDCLQQTTVDPFLKSSMSDPDPLQAAGSREAELEMSRLFRQEWFGDLQILGQFNRGFIIGQLGRDLFIIDQHASDEKYNFEDLQRTTTISKQQLVRPLALEFSAQDELIVLQHIDAFRAGGFGIEYKANNKPTQRLFLRSQPVSKHTMFVQDDLKEMVAMLKTSVLQSSSLNVGVLRPPRIRAMFASRACRKSVMIGTALHKPQMERIVRNLTSIEHPWTCPHGRPTMRHLCTLPGT